MSQVDEIVTGSASTYLLYPNPGDGNMILQFDNPTGELLEISVFDWMGGMVCRKTFSCTNIQNIALTHLMPGGYVMKINGLVSLPFIIR